MGERFLNRRLAGSGLSSGTAPLLLELEDGKECNLVALATAVGVDKVYITRSIHSLEQAGYVVVIPAVEDGRSSIVSLTRKGQDAAVQVKEAMHAWIAIVGQGVNQADLNTANVVLDQFYINAREYFSK
jgi:DNA-binding MarR family transcriptional regulator